MGLVWRGNWRVGRSFLGGASLSFGIQGDNKERTIAVFLFLFFIHMVRSESGGLSHDLRRFIA